MTVEEEEEEKIIVEEEEEEEKMTVGAAEHEYESEFVLINTAKMISQDVHFWFIFRNSV